MKFQCTECGHIGAAEEVRPSGDGVEVVCESCGEASPLEASDESDGEGDSEEDGGANDWSAPDESGESPLEGTDGNLEEAVEADIDLESRRDSDGLWALADAISSDEPQRDDHDLTVSQSEALDRLIPDEGADRRCPKCASPVGDRRHCSECGLDLERAEEYDEGEAPWAQPPEGREEAYEQAEALWKTFADPQGGEKELEKFTRFVRDLELYELGIRKLRFHLAEDPDDELAVEALEELTEGIQGRIVAAQSKAEADARELNEEISRFQRGLVWVVLILCLAVGVGVAFMIL